MRNFLYFQYEFNLKKFAEFHDETLKVQNYDYITAKIDG